MSTAALPRLLYAGDVPVESSYHGSALLYRLLETYPADRLLIVEGGGHPSAAERRLRDVRYDALRVPESRLAHSRLHTWWSLWLSLVSASWARQIDARLRGFSPEAVLTVAHGHSWVAAAAFAGQRAIPLHLIVHDDWPRVAELPWPATRRVERQFARIYPSAASRLCVSPAMAEAYLQRYAAEGNVLYPSRARGAAGYDAPPPRLHETGRGLTVAFAGTINTPDYYLLLAAIARGLAPSGGRVLVFGPMTAAQAAAGGLSEPNAHLCGLLESRALMARLREEADVLLLPMSFARVHEANMRVSFPSKLTDYTSVGLPLLIHGPSYCSAVRWAREHPGVAEVVDEQGVEPVIAAIRRLAGDPARRQHLAARALEVGRAMFSHDAAWRVFTASLTAGRAA